RQCRDRLTETSSALLSETAQAALQRGLLGQFGELCGPTLYEDFLAFQIVRQPMMRVLALPGGNRASRSAYDAYISELRGGRMRDYFLDRPVLARLLATVTEQWIEATAELLRRLDADFLAIYQAFGSGAKPGPVTDIHFGVSDAHNKGRKVCIL